jgi:uncharacterized protein
MLSFEHVNTKRKGNELLLAPLKPALRARAIELGELLFAEASASVGKSREELEQALRAIAVAPREKRLFLGLCKLLEDACEFEMVSALEPAELRRELFLRAAELRRKGDFDREKLFAESAGARGLSLADVEGALYADLRGAHRLLSCRVSSGERLLSEYERGQVQALLLRAVKVTAIVRCQSPDAYRELFRKLKFRQLLHRIEPLPDGRYRIEIDGPYSLFDSVSKYGLELALTLPALEAAGDLELVAMVQLREGSAPLCFRHYSMGGQGRAGEPIVRDEVAELLTALNAAGGGVRAELNDRILELPGLGLCVPDLAISVGRQRRPIYVELLGFWSRDSVWRRIELVQRGLGERIVFAVSSRLRVSEELLEDHESAALYVYRGRINPRALLRSVLALAGAAG